MRPWARRWVRSRGGGEAAPAQPEQSYQQQPQQYQAPTACNMDQQNLMACLNANPGNADACRFFFESLQVGGPGGGSWGGACGVLCVAIALPPTMYRCLPDACMVLLCVYVMCMRRLCCRLMSDGVPALP